MSNDMVSYTREEDLELTAAYFFCTQWHTATFATLHSLWPAWEAHIIPEGSNASSFGQYRTTRLYNHAKKHLHLHVSFHNYCRNMSAQAQVITQSSSTGNSTMLMGKGLESPEQTTCTPASEISRSKKNSHTSGNCTRSKMP